MLIAEAVAFQFGKIGNDEAAHDLVVGLTDDPFLGSYIDCMGTSSGHDSHQLFVYVSLLIKILQTGGEYKLEDILKDMWRIVSQH